MGEVRVCIRRKERHDPVYRGAAPIFCLLWDGILEKQAVHRQSSSAKRTDKDGLFFERRDQFCQNNASGGVGTDGGKGRVSFFRICEDSVRTHEKVFW